MTDSSAPYGGFTVPPPPPAGPDPLTGAPDDGDRRLGAPGRRAVPPQHGAGGTPLAGATLAPSVAGALMAVVLLNAVGPDPARRPPSWPPAATVATLVVTGYRVLLTALVAGAFSTVGSTVVEVPVFVAGAAGLGDPSAGLHLNPVATVVSGVLGLALTAPATVVTAAGMLATYAELRGREWDAVTGPDLAAAA